MGKKIDFGENNEIDKKEVFLKPDLNTIREVSWNKGEALVFADTYCN